MHAHGVIRVEFPKPAQVGPQNVDLKFEIAGRTGKAHFRQSFFQMLSRFLPIAPAIVPAAIPPPRREREDRRVYAGLAWIPWQPQGIRQAARTRISHRLIERPSLFAPLLPDLFDFKLKFAQHFFFAGRELCGSRCCHKHGDSESGKSDKDPIPIQRKRWSPARYPRTGTTTAKPNKDPARIFRFNVVSAAMAASISQPQFSPQPRRSSGKQSVHLRSLACSALPVHFGIQECRAELVQLFLKDIGLILQTTLTF